MRRPRADPLSSTSSPSSSAQHQSRSQEPRAPRYHINHFDTGGMPVSLWGMDRRDVWRTCFCFHVRTVTIFIGVWYLMIYILTLSYHAALLMYEPGHDGYPMTTKPESNNMLPTPVSKIGPEPKPLLFNPADFLQSPPTPRTPEKLTIDNSYPRSRVDTMKSSPLTFVLDTNRKTTSQVILLTVCNMLITLLMVYGAVRGKPSYLMPFFVLRVFDFCIFCLTMVGYFSYLPSVTEGTQGLPFRDELLRMDPQLLSFITLVFIVAFIAVKAYIIGVIWNCYKYLMLRNTVIRGVIAYRHDDPTSIMGLQQNLLPDLPDYETAVNDPRYAKKPPAENGPSHSTVVSGNPVVASNPTSIAMPPPPPYSVAVASEPLHLVIPIPIAQPEAHQTTEHIVKENETIQQTSPIFVPVHPQSADHSAADSTVTTPTVTASTDATGTVDVPPPLVTPSHAIQHQ